MDFDPIAYISQPSWQGSKPGLQRIGKLLDHLGNPQKRLRFVHVAGTNGKGSICAYLSSALTRCGYRTGLFTSPFIETFEERMRIDGRSISIGDLRDVTLSVKEAVESIDENPTEFEIMCAVAMEYFAREKCDIVVLEVGLGGRFDATNVIDAPEVAIIARMGLDHTDILGNTMVQIAGEKAGIIKPGTVVVGWPQGNDADDVIERAARDAHAPLRRADFDQLDVHPLIIDPEFSNMNDCVRMFAYRGESFTTKLLASYQPGNAAVAIEALWALRDLGWGIADDGLREGIAAATWPGRFEIVGTKPLAIVDGGHNPQGVAALVQTLDEVLPGIRPVFIVGMLSDKDYSQMVRIALPKGRAFFTISPESPRALSADDLAGEFHAASCESGGEHPVIEACESVRKAVWAARQCAGDGGIICYFGSLYSVAEVKRALRYIRHEQER